MGTRNLTCVVLNGEYKVAKYGQWDGYLESLGIGILKFLRDDFNREAFLKGLSKVKEITDEKLQDLWCACGAERGKDFVSCDISDKFNKKHPEIGRDMPGYSLLKEIQNGTVRFSRREEGFAADSLFCEWAYVVDLDKNTFEVYKGFNKKPLPATERFANLPMENFRPDQTEREYYQVRHVKSYKLNRLPSDKTFMRIRSVGNRWDKEWAASEKTTKVDSKAAALVS